MTDVPPARRSPRTESEDLGLTCFRRDASHARPTGTMLSRRDNWFSSFVDEFHSELHSTVIFMQLRRSNAMARRSVTPAALSVPTWLALLLELESGVAVEVLDNVFLLEDVLQLRREDGSDASRVDGIHHLQEKKKRHLKYASDKRKRCLQVK